MDFFLVDKSTVRASRARRSRSSADWPSPSSRVRPEICAPTTPCPRRRLRRRCRMTHPPGRRRQWPRPVPPQSRGMQNQTAAAKGRSRRRRKHPRWFPPPQLRLGPTRRVRTQQAPARPAQIRPTPARRRARRLPMLRRRRQLPRARPERTPPRRKIQPRARRLPTIRRRRSRRPIRPLRIPIRPMDSLIISIGRTWLRCRCGQRGSPDKVRCRICRSFPSSCFRSS